MNTGPTRAVGATPAAGLSDAAARARLLADGPNQLPRGARRTPLRIVLEVLREPMLALLLGGGVVYIILGSLQEAVVLLTFATLSVVITVVQEARTERVLEALRDLTSPRALVVRDGNRRRIAGADVVRGDVLVLGEGDRVAADAVLVECHDLQTDESLLTGESVPVRKIARPAGAVVETGRPGGDDRPHVFSGSLVVRGSGLAEVVATGARSEIGRIGHALGAIDTEPPRLQAQTRRAVRLFAVAGGAVSVLTVVLYGLLRGGWLEALLAGIALGMSMLPEEFPVVLTVFMAMGAWRISRVRVLTRRASAIETLGSATVLCTDKTGTLTENQMRVAELRTAAGDVVHPRDAAGATLPESCHTLVEYSLLASAEDPFDPMEKAFRALGSQQLPSTEHLHTGRWTLRKTYPLQADLLAMTQLWQVDGSSDAWVAAAKGAPEAIASLCGLEGAALVSLTGAVDAMADEGLRVLGVARASGQRRDWPDSSRGFAFELVGLVGLADPVRASVPAAVADCRTAGIRVVMITGDYPATARAIARQAGIDADVVLSGDGLDALTADALAAHVRTTTVFARVLPEQKLRIVEALKAAGEIVAMTGDGVNDAPSLKAAHIGIAMGGRGTDVAREASSIVLLDDDFGSIVAAVRLGRRIYDNLTKAMGFILAVHVPIAGLALLPLFLGLPIVLGPMHIAFLEMVIDPVCSLVFEAEEPEGDVMQRRPRAPDTPLFPWSLVRWSLVQGTAVLLLVAGLYLVATRRGMPEPEVRSLTFFSLVIAIVSLIFVNRSFSASLRTALSWSNVSLRWVLVAVVVMLGVTLWWPLARGVFRFGPLHADDLAVTVAGGVLVLGLLEGVKALRRSTQGAGPRGA